MIKSKVIEVVGSGVYLENEINKFLLENIDIEICHTNFTTIEKNGKITKCLVIFFME